MTYRALARKWRPKTLDTLIGQPVLIQTLKTALQRQQLHHAYLFTGTRGVGKTSIARILAKCLNCEEGITDTPCGKCDACVAIDAGRFPDLIEVDAASRTRVEETRDLLDNVPYAPTQGRFKVYLIDEVHMLSGHSFNALLKTLEEPPEHVKFFLATTDPQKLPVTILSRCLQFTLKALPQTGLADHLKMICQEEDIKSSEAALMQIALAAAGSVRDALSLLEQAIAYSRGDLTIESVQQMLGATPEKTLLGLLSQITDGNVSEALASVDQMASNGVLFDSALTSLIGLLHQLCVMQLVPGRVDPSILCVEQLSAIAQKISPDKGQLLYQLALLGKRDFALSPNAKTAFEMLVMRLCCFKMGQTAAPQMAAVTAAPGQEAKVLAPISQASAEKPAAKPVAAIAQTTPMPASDRDWKAVFSVLPVSGLNKIVLQAATVLRWEAPFLSLEIPDSQSGCLTDDRKKTLASAISQAIGEDVKVRYTVGEGSSEAPKAPKEAKAPEAMPEAPAPPPPADPHKVLESDTQLKALVDAFDATIEKVSTLKNDKLEEDHE